MEKFQPPLAEGYRQGDVITESSTALPVVALRRSSRVSALPGMSLFSLGPAYVLLRIDHDLIKDFMNASQPFDVESIQYDIPIFSQLNEWNHILQAIPDSIYPAFTKFCINIVFANAAEKSYFRLNRLTFSVLRPRGNPSESVAIDIFLPSGNKNRIMCESSQLPFVLGVRPPAPLIIHEATQYFSVVHGVS